MGIVHLESRRTSVESEFLDQRSSHSSLLFVNEAAIIDRFSLELKVGSAWAKVYSPSQRAFVQIDERGIKIGRHDSIVIEVEEEIRVPNNMYGILVPTGSLFLGMGILIAPAKIEPGYSGKLMLRLYNTTSEKFTLKKSDKLGSAIFFTTDSTQEHTKITKDRGASVAGPSKLARFLVWAKTNPTVWITWLVAFLGSSTISMFAGYFILQKIPQQNQTPPIATPASNPPTGKPNNSPPTKAPAKNAQSTKPLPSASQTQASNP